MPVLAPAELWQQTGRYRLPVVWKTEDRSGRPFVLAMTHEETVTFHARELQSYKQLPQILYHFQTKVREEPRPRGGLLRVREFVMKDAYSFDRDEEGLDVSFKKHWAAYDRIFERCGVEVRAVEAESGEMGGASRSTSSRPPARARTRSSPASAATTPRTWRSRAACLVRPEFPGRLDAPVEIETPGIETIEALAELLGIDPAATSKAMPVVRDGTVVLALVRGDDRLEEAKLAAVLGGDVRPRDPRTRFATAFGADPGSLGPVGFDGEVVADEALREGQFVAGANRTGRHLRGVEHGRDFEARFADIREAQEGDSCPRCGGTLRFQTAIELGHIFKLGTYYSTPLRAMYLDESGKEQPIVMGSYGIGPGRVMAAVVEQHHDEHGIVWPRSIAPYDVHVVALPGLDEQADEVATALEAHGHEVLLDDRDQRAGEKFADADLIGCPVRVTVGKKTLDDGAVDVRDRSTGEERRVPMAELGALP